MLQLVTIYIKKRLDLYGQIALYYSMIEMLIYNPFMWVGYFWLGVALYTWITNTFYTTGHWADLTKAVWFK